MSLSAEEGICFLQELVNQPGCQRFHVVPETSTLTGSEAFSFMERCWNAAVHDARDDDATVTAAARAATRLDRQTFPRPPQASTQKAVVVCHDTPSAVAPSRTDSETGGFFATAVVQAQPSAGSRCGRNGVAWVVL